MDISTIVVVLILIVLFFGGIVWMEVHSRTTGSGQDTRMSLESKETNLEQY
jgi:hypothetical protein